MARVIYQGAPDVRPAGPPGVFEHVPAATPEAFGGLIGAAEQRTGAETTQGGNELFGAYEQRQNLFNQAASDNAWQQFNKGTQDVLYGDPNDPSKPGYYDLKGEDALRARPQVMQHIDDLRNQILGGLQNERQRVEFNSASRRLQMFTTADVGRHYEQQLDVYAHQTNMSGLANDAQAVGLDFTSDQTFNDRLVEAQRRAVDEAGREGAPTGSPRATQLQNVFQSQIAASRLKGYIEHNDWAGAKSFLDQHGALLGDDLGTAQRQVQQHAKLAQMHAAVFGGEGGTPFAPAGGGQNNPGNIRVPGSTGTGQQAFQSFPTMEEGVKAIGDNLLAYQDQHGVNTLAGVISRWAPPNENPTAQLIQNASARTGIAPNQPIDLHDAATRAKVTQAIIQQEQGGSAPNVAAQLTDQGSVPAAQVPGLAAKLDALQKQFPDPDDFARVSQMAETQYRAAWADQTRAYELHQREVKQASDEAEKKITADLYSDNPKITAQQIAAGDPSLPLTAEAQQRMLKFVEAGPDPKVNSRVSQQTAMHLFNDMRLPPGDPARVTDTGPIDDAYGQGKLGRTDRDWLVNQLATVRTADGEKLATKERDFTNGMKSAITKSNPLMGSVDREGDAKFYEFTWDVNHAIEQYRAEGKNPADLFNPHKPDYLGTPGALRPYTTTTEQSMEHVTQTVTGAQPAAPEAPASASPAILPRRPGETMQDWVARMHLGMPGQP